MRDPRIDRLANVLVTYSVAVRPGDLVRILGSTAAMPLVRAVYREVLRAGGNPMLRLLDGECADIFYAEASDKQLGYLSPLVLEEVEKIDCSITLWAEENTKSTSRVDPARQALVSQARKPVTERFLQRGALKGKNKLRWTATDFPSQASAQDAERSLAEYEDFVFRAGFLDRLNPVAEWRKLSERQKRLADFLNKAREIRFKTPHGTDLRLGVKGRRWISCDGHENFPDGEVFTGPIEDATEGTVAYTFPAVHMGREVENIRLTFKAGRVVDASATKGQDFLISMLDQDKGARTLGEIAVGTNYAVKEFTRNTLFDEKIGGTFHAAVGAGYPESGSRNRSGLHWDMVCDLRQGGTLEVDGKVIARNGKFLKAQWPQPMRG